MNRKIIKKIMEQSLDEEISFKRLKYKIPHKPRQKNFKTWLCNNKIIDIDDALYFYPSLALQHQRNGPSIFKNLSYGENYKRCMTKNGVLNSNLRK